MTPVPDLLRWVALQAYGALRFMTSVQGSLEDIEGAIDGGQYGMLAFQARHVVLVCLSIRSLAREGEIDFDEMSVAFDYFAGLPGEEIAAALELSNEAVGLDERKARDWLTRVRSYVAETERLLGHGSPLPILRSPEGAFAVIGLARKWTPLLDELGLPPLLPSDWVPRRDPGSKVTSEMEPGSLVKENREPTANER
jgi:hypothetical protein